MPRCKACDYCDSTGEMSPYKWGLSVPGYSGTFIVDPNSGDEYCLGCWINVYDLFDVEEQGGSIYGTEGWAMDSMGGSEMEIMGSRDAGRDEETYYESGS